MATWLTWRERLIVDPGLQSLSNWPDINLDLLPKQKRSTYIINRSIIAKILQGKSAKTVGKEHDVSNAKITRLLNRALAGFEDTPPALTQALIPNIHLKKATRKQALPSYETSISSRCAFSYILDNAKGLKKRLEDALILDLKDKAEGQNLRPNELHGLFKHHLETIKWPKDQYPYIHQDLAYESVRRFYHAFRDAWELKCQVASDAPCLRRQRIDFKPLSEVQIDEQIYDQSTHCVLDFNRYEVPLRLARTSLIIIGDKESGCILSYESVWGKSPNQYDIISAYRKIYRPWKPKINVSELEDAYLPFAGFPCNEIDNFKEFGIQEVRLDNAMVHRSESVKRLIVDTGSTCNLGKPSLPTDRDFIERAIKMAANFAHRSKSTSGSHINDPKKESRHNQKKLPAMSIQLMEACLHVVIANYNATSSVRLGGLSPIEALKQSIAKDWHRYQPEHIQNKFLEGTLMQIRKVHWYKNEHRVPHINFMSLRYTGSCLSDLLIVGKQVYIHYNPDDIRSIEVTTLKGKSIGTVQCPKTWRRKPLSIKTLKMILNYVKGIKRSSKDPFIAVFEALSSKKDSPKHALELSRLSKEWVKEDKTTIDSNESSLQNDSLDIKNPKENHHTNEDFKVPEWTPEYAGINPQKSIEDKENGHDDDNK